MSGATIGYAPISGTVVAGMYVHMSAHTQVHRSMPISVHMSVRMSVHMSADMSMRMLTQTFVHMSTHVYILEGSSGRSLVFVGSRRRQNVADNPIVVTGVIINLLL